MHNSGLINEAASNTVSDLLDIGFSFHSRQPRGMQCGRRVFVGTPNLGHLSFSKTVAGFRQGKSGAERADH
jgi:hypothetical protein